MNSLLNKLANKLTFFMLTLSTALAYAQQSSSELTCRAKAKEIAAQTYSVCVTEARNSQIDQIRKDYQRQLSELKSKYDRELKKVSGKSVTNAPVTKAISTVTTPLVSMGSTPKATKGIAKTLPTRKEVKNAPPLIQPKIQPKVQPAIQEVQDDKIVVSPDSIAPGVENEATQNDANSEIKGELVPVPASSDQTAASSEDLTY